MADITKTTNTDFSANKTFTTIPQASSSLNPTITSHKLNGSNYLQWSQSVKLFIRGRGKFGYLSGATMKPDPGEGNVETWEAENSMIMSWLINSMEQDIGKTYLFLASAKDLWEAVKETYSDLGNSAQLFEIKLKLRETKHGYNTVTQYDNVLKNLWQECDMFMDFEWTCATDSVKYQKILEKERVFEFLAGLNKDLDEVRGRILGREPMPSTREVFSEVRREETRRVVMLRDIAGPISGVPVSENSALMIRGSDEVQSGHGKPAEMKGNNPNLLQNLNSKILGSFVTSLGWKWLGPRRE